MKTALITGGNRGIGLGITRQLALQGYRVIVAARDILRSKDIVDALPNGSAMFLNLASLKSIHTFCSKYRNEIGTLDILINNAGLLSNKEERTADGFEVHFGVNYLGHFALTGLLLDLLVASAGKVITVSSNLHKTVRPWDKPHDLQHWSCEGQSIKAYSRSKYLNLMFAFELARRSEGIITSLAAHPGGSRTGLFNSNSNGMLLKSLKILSLFGTSADQGASYITHAVTQDDIKSGSYIGPTKLHMFGQPGDVQVKPEIRDTNKAQELWILSESISGVHYKF